MRKKLFAMILATMLMLMFSFSAMAQGNANEAILEKDLPNVQNLETSLSTEQITKITVDVKNQILTKYAGIYSFDNFSFDFLNEKLDNGQVSVDVNVHVDMTLVRHPVDSPYVQGMKVALLKIQDDDEKAIAEEEINNYLKEVEQYYNVPSPSAILYQIHIPQQSTLKVASNSYELFYRTDITQDETILESVNLLETLDETTASLEGIEAVTQAVSDINSPKAQLLAVSYDRIAAQSYALAHGTDVPEFSAANGMGSDCANFVSKALNAGGIPVDKSGNWYPSPSSGSYAGDNWMRTGYYANGGVVPYVVGKGYFALQSTFSKVAAGAILSRTDTSHVALVTYGDGTTVKYTEHSNVKRTEVNIVLSSTIKANSKFYTPSI